MADFIDDELADVVIESHFRANNPNRRYMSKSEIPAFTSEYYVYMKVNVLKPTKMTIEDIGRIYQLLKRVENEFDDFKYVISDIGLTIEISMPPIIEKPVCPELTELLQKATEFGLDISFRPNAGHDNITISKVAWSGDGNWFDKVKVPGTDREIMKNYHKFDRWVDDNTDHRANQRLNVTNSSNGKKAELEIYKKTDFKWVIDCDRVNRMGIHEVVMNYLESVGKRPSMSDF